MWQRSDIGKNIRKNVMSWIPPKRHLDHTVNGYRRTTHDPKKKKKSSRSCGRNTRIGRETRSVNNISVKRQGRFGRTAVEMNMNESSWEIWLGMAGCECLKDTDSWESSSQSKDSGKSSYQFLGNNEITSLAELILPSFINPWQPSGITGILNTRDVNILEVGLP